MSLKLLYRSLNHHYAFDPFLSIIYEIFFNFLGGTKRITARRDSWFGGVVMGVATLPVLAEDTSIHNYNSKTRNWE